MKNKAIIFSFLSLLTSTSIHADQVTIHVIKNISRTLYISTDVLDDPPKASPDVITQKMTDVTITNVNPSVRTFEISFGFKPGYWDCTFSYKLPQGLETADCPDLKSKISGDGNTITFNK